ncbi:MAG TPA: hypothetical protein VNY34_02415, partial [Solirubrobacteraceae bacterium]|nr:hypothetical protein [Solirubrobacteraceae bacterium]
MSQRLISVLEEDPDLGESLDPGQLRKATGEAVASVFEVTEELPVTWPASLQEGLGLLVLDGLLLRRVGLEGRFGAELLGPGDLLRPWQAEDTLGSIPQVSSWRVLRRGRIAVLDL